MTEQPLIFDGAMGTVIYDRGIFINTCFDELNLTNSKLIQKIHSEYVEAGAQVLETNTFGANRIKLAAFGLATKVDEINSAAVRCAREAAGDDIYVIGSVGPCTKSSEILQSASINEVQEAFKEQIASLVKAGVDGIILETFSKLDELDLAIKAAESFDVPLIASFTVGHEGLTITGTPATAVVDFLDQNKRVQAIGINCGTGPAGAFSTLEKVISRSHKPFIVMPNAGMPRDVGGRML